VPGAPAAPAEPATVEQRLAEYEQRTLAAERRSNEAMAAVAPWLRQMQAQLSGQQPQIPTREFLNTDQAGTNDLLNYIDGNMQQGISQAMQVAQLQAGRAASEAHVRGLFNPQAMPDGWTFDQIRSTYCQPLFEANPALRDMLAQVSPDSPALAEYGLGVLLMLDKAAGGDPLKTYQMLAAAMAGTQGKQALQQVNRAARSAASRISAASASGRPTGGGRRKVAADEIPEMSDAEFDAMDQQLTGGV
jgi:hypothetical protein